MPDDWTLTSEQPLPAPDKSAPTIRVRAAKLTPEELTQKATGLGYGPGGAAGVVKNILRESGGDPASVGDGTTSLGLFQHHADRKKALEDFAHAQGGDPTDPDIQFRFADQELRTQYPKLRAMLTNPETTEAQANEAFKRIFERPKDDFEVTSTDKFRWSNYALRQHQGEADTDVVYMSPDDYLSLAPTLEATDASRKADRSLRKSVAAGDEIEAIPTLDVAVDKGGAKVTGQDGRHRAMLAKESGLDLIPVAVKRSGQGAVTELEGAGGALLPYDWQKVPEVAREPGMLESLGRGAVAGIGKAAGAAAELGGKLLAGPEMPAAIQGPVGRATAAAGNAVTDAGRGVIGDSERLAAPAEAAHPIIEEAGELLGGSLLPGAGAARMGGGALRMGATAGALGGALTPAKGEGLEYGATKALQVGAGTVLGAAAGKGAELLTRAVAPVVAPLVRYVTGIKGPQAVESAAGKEILRRIEQDAAAGGPTAQDMLDLLAKTPGKPMTLADVGGANLQALAGRIARAPGEQRQIMQKFFAERDLDAGLRLASDVDRALGKENAFDVADALAKARSTAARPAYDRAFATPVTMAQVRPLQRMIGDPIGQEALQKGMRVAELEDLAAGRLFNPERYGVVRSDQTGRWIIDPDVLNGKKAPSLRMLDAVKRGYDEIVEGFRDPTSGRLNLNQYGRAVNDVRAAYVGALRNEFPAYADALNAWSGPSQSLGALKAGEDFLKSGPEQIARRIMAFSKSDREFFKLGAASTLRRAISKTGASGDEARKIVGNAYTRAQLRPLFDDDASYQHFIDSVLAESRMFRTGVKMLGGSQTAERMAEDMSPEAEAFLRAGHGAAQAAHGNYFGAAMNAMKAARDYMRAPDPTVGADIARLLTGAPPPGGASPGMKLLRDFSSVGPNTRQFLGQGMQPAAPFIGAGAQQLLQPRIGQ